jgi:hypothetical protein
VRNNANVNAEVTTGNPKSPLWGNFFRWQQGVFLSNKCLDRDIDRGSFKKLPLTKQLYYSRTKLYSPLRAQTDSYTCSDSGNFLEEVEYFAFIPALKAANKSDLVTTCGNLVVT